MKKNKGLGFEVHIISDKLYLLGGLGKMFYQEGMPIGMLAKEINNKGIR